LKKRPEKYGSDTGEQVVTMTAGRTGEQAVQMAAGRIGLENKQ
jgi:hypothetical protein